MSTTRRIGREIGTALAVLAIYLLTVLSPLHQARASQLAFEELGYTTTQASWVLCTADGVDKPDSDAAIAKCPATGVGKAEFALPVLDIQPVRHDVALAAPRPAALAMSGPRATAPPAGPRAPPVSV
ncbi:hypothetical protein JI749_00185 [Devosia oryziradicis]|uniref:Uncharacterized protein n=1 Tax=Devosia oryziradicis TaxID=2801335 RepID=A0ABX7BYK4_9HYPH|nr:hypothetical protein [Devosia oryziradicis]QQR36104.1 hypothetical protein JI749_00185 [Devosia oryziradicis]